VGCGDGLEQRLGQKEGKGKVCSFLFFQFLFPPKTNKQNLNSKQDLNPNTQKQCNGMNATHSQLFI
jgi:hypothetical protein